MKKNKNKIAFPGSFNFIHEGHIFLIKSQIDKYDNIYILISNNSEKFNYSFFSRKNKIKKIIKEQQLDTKKIKIIVNKGLTTDKLKKLKIDTILRGYRDENDYEYENNLFEVYKKDIPNLKRILIKSDEEHRNIRSSSLNKH